MVIRVINYSTYEEWYEEKFVKSLTQLTDKEFMDIYNREGNDWEFSSIKDFCDEFNTDGPYAPTPSSHIIRFFPNE